MSSDLEDKEFQDFLHNSKCKCDRCELRFSGKSEEEILKYYGPYEIDNTICLLIEPMRYSHSAFLYRYNIGKPICNKCDCWGVYASQLSGCFCMCHNSNVWASR